MIDCAPKPAIIDFSLDVVITRKREITRRGGAAMTTGTSITVQKGCDCRGKGDSGGIAPGRGAGWTKCIFRIAAATGYCEAECSYNDQ